jgi:hypothetical protein
MILRSQSNNTSQPRQANPFSLRDLMREHDLTLQDGNLLSPQGDSNFAPPRDQPIWDRYEKSDVPAYPPLSHIE